ncbi:hypothetical protein CLOM_g22214 [Closterium sp. NIES-68]|nr:hypothetical protein CLOM_g22214 [Closterium sp. NIES-68]GJP79148.1 hypothetical protein CLOP_g9393 [Closterium sp. NIES-67]
MGGSAGDGGESTTGGGDSDVSCWYSRVERRQCRVVRDEKGRPVKECERTHEVLRQCAGRPSEVVESHSEVTREDLPPGSELSASTFSSSSSSSSFSYGGGATSTHPSPDAPSLPSPFSHFPFSLPSPFSSRPPPSLPPSDPHSSSPHSSPPSPWSSFPSVPPSAHPNGPSSPSLPADLPSLPDVIRSAEQLASEVFSRFGMTPPTGFPGSGEGEQGSGSEASGWGGPWSVFRFGMGGPSTQIWEDESSVLDGSGVDGRGVGSEQEKRHGSAQGGGQGSGQAMGGNGSDGRGGIFGRWIKRGGEQGSRGWGAGQGRARASEEEKYREFSKDFQDV